MATSGSFYFVPDKAAIPVGGLTMPSLFAYDRLGRLVKEWGHEALAAGDDLGLASLLDAPPVGGGTFPTLADAALHLEVEDGSRPTLAPSDLTLVWVFDTQFAQEEAVSTAIRTFSEAHPGRVSVVHAPLDRPRYLRRYPGTQIQRRDQ